MTGLYRLALFTWSTFLATTVSRSFECPDVENKEDVMVSVKSRCYHYVETVDEQVTYTTAEQSCNSRDGHIVTIKDNVTQAALVNHLQFLSDSHTVLLGLKKVGNEWKWITGETLSYSNWDSRTTCSGTCNCAKMKLSSEGRWEQFGCELSDWYTVYICEYGHNSCPPKTGQLLMVTMCATLALLQQIKAGYS